MTIGSLFSGIGGLELGSERAGLGPTVWQCESNPFCLSVLAKHWPSAQRFNDIKTLKEAPRVETICGGFPCQPFSSASRGRRVAEDLWPFMLNVCRGLRPRFVVAENVAREPIERSCEDLRAEGYAATAIEVSASVVGATHDRERWFMVADSNGQGQSRFAIHEEVARIQNLPGMVRWSVPPSLVGVDDGVPYRMDRLRALGNSVLPQVAELIGNIIIQLRGEQS